MTRTKVLCLLDSLVEIGGAETLAVAMTLGLDRDRYEPTFVLTRWSDEVAAAEPARTALVSLAQAGIAVRGLRRSSKVAVRPWAQLTRMLRRECPDVIHAHKFGSNMYGTALGRLTGVPVVVAHEHMWSYEEGGIRNVVDRELIARFADAFIAVSEEGRRQMIERQGIHPTDVRFIPNGFPSRPKGDGPAARAALGIADDSPVVVSVGNLRPEKAFEVLIEAAARLHADWPELRVLIVGKGGERGALEAQIASHGLGRTVQLLGYRADVADLLACADIAVCCSDYEGGPLSVMEYMDAGLPTVATAVGGLPELIGDGLNGALVPARDPQALAAAVDRLIARPDERRALGDGARTGSRELYGMDAWVRAIEALYDELLLARRRQSST